MKHYGRLTLGLFFAFLAGSAYAREGENYARPLFFGVITALLLYKELFASLSLLWGFVRSAGKRLWGQVKEVEEMRYCKCCGKLAVYLVTTCVPNPNTSGPIPERRAIFVCREHHPNPNIGLHAEDLHAYIRGKVHPAATNEYVFPV